jgi:class 3 adenylate cyclase
VLDRKVVHIPDVLAEPGWDRGDWQTMGDFRSALAVPLLRNEDILGVLVLHRTQVLPFTEKQIAIIETYAAQAVIAIENARLLNETKEALEQQRASAEVLNVISNSLSDAEPVFEKIVESCQRIFATSRIGLNLIGPDGLVHAGAYGNFPGAENLRRENFPHPVPGSATGAAISAGRPIQYADALSGPDVPQYGRRAAKILGLRAFLMAPLLSEGRGLGAIFVGRETIGSFSDKEVALLKTFAAQAVIAIENTRLLRELRQSTDQLKAQSHQLANLNQELERRVADQIGEIERMSRLRRFLPPQVADLIVASGTEKQLESHRREITALFCDLRGFTGFSESSDPEDVMALLADYHAAIGTIINKYSGTLERYAGDGVMVIFNDPVPVENPALQAVLMALDMRSAIGGLIERWRDLGHDLGFGIGIAHGFATLGTIGFEGRWDYAAIGTVSNVASRLCDEAKPGQILISPRVRQAVEKAIMVEQVGEFALKGIRRPMLAYNVLASSPSKPN